MTATYIGTDILLTSVHDIYIPSLQ